MSSIQHHHGGNGQIVAVVSIFNFSRAQIRPVRIEFCYHPSVIVECDDLIRSTGATGSDDFKDDVRLLAYGVDRMGRFFESGHQ